MDTSPASLRSRLWQAVHCEAAASAADEPLLASFLHMTVLRHRSIEDELSFHLSSKLGAAVMDSRAVMELISEALASDASLCEAMLTDIEAYYIRDPACDAYSTPLLYYKGFHAIQSYRVTHWLWQQGRRTLALFLQNRVSEVMGVDIHPAAKLGRGIMLDHATGFVVGETAVIGDNVSILQGVTLGGTGKESGDRHPKIANGVLIGANATVLGNITVGECAKIGAGSVVLEAVPPHATVAGVPARIVAMAGRDTPALSMDQRFVGLT